MTARHTEPFAPVRLSFVGAALVLCSAHPLKGARVPLHAGCRATDVQTPLWPAGKPWEAINW